MNNGNKKRKKKKIKNPVLEKIKELIPKAPACWKEVLAANMQVSQDAISKYIRGDRGKRGERHIEVLRELKKLVELENNRMQKLLS